MNDLQSDAVPFDLKCASDTWNAFLLWDAQTEQLKIQVEGIEFNNIPVAPIATFFAVKAFKNQVNDQKYGDYM